MLVLTKSTIAIAAFTFVNVVHGLATRATCPSSQLASGPSACAATSKALGIYRHDKLSPSSSWDGPLDCQGEFCVYSNQAVSKHRWAVLCTTPEVAKHVQSHFYIRPKSPIHPETLLEAIPCHVAEIPGKGRGLIASRKILEGEQIIAEDAILALPIHAHLELQPERRASLYDMVLENLPREARDEFLSQAGDDVTTILNRNGFEIHTGRDDDDVRYVGAFPEQALINHDCRPSLAYHFRGITHITIAVRDIEAGEELSLSYIDATLPTRHRQAGLSALWEFKCTCKQCQLAPAEAEASEARLDRIKALEDSLDHPAKSFPAGDLKAQTGAELVRLYEQDRLDVYVGYAYRRAALNFAVFGDAPNATRFARRALEALRRQGGAGQKDLENMRGLLTDPKAHWSWGRLVAPPPRPRPQQHRKSAGGV
ncbi:hypothetical protein KVR01_007516 [Diaporthe batatas]|uniref:uncharacterized protein n=1 Tax=Diaporthe batatas TaxID=748121 RepID=UPI001D04BC22|nr:uncharacterized protein KVR01_007516 [Diaporthe batatas]KAG8163038.1 hypothetical protein KVR01_007516 [Diaporthe batatas]